LEPPHQLELVLDFDELALDGGSSGKGSRKSVVLFHALLVVRVALFQALDVVLVTFLVAFLTDPVMSGIFHCGTQDEDAFEVAPTSDVVVDDAKGPQDQPVVSAKTKSPKQQQNATKIDLDRSECIPCELPIKPTSSNTDLAIAKNGNVCPDRFLTRRSPKDDLRFNY
jgi:hypothetical protein